MEGPGKEKAMQLRSIDVEKRYQERAVKLKAMGYEEKHWMLKRGAEY